MNSVDLDGLLDPEDEGGPADPDARAFGIPQDRHDTTGADAEGARAPAALWC